MISIIEFIKGGIVNNLIKVGLNVILCDRGKGMTTFLIEYVNSLPHNKIIMFATLNSELARWVKHRITHPNCEVRILHEYAFMGRSVDYIVCDNFFKTEDWFRCVCSARPNLINGGIMIMGESDDNNYLNNNNINRAFLHSNNVNTIDKRGVEKIKWK